MPSSSKKHRRNLRHHKFALLVSRLTGTRLAEPAEARRRRLFVAGQPGCYAEVDGAGSACAPGPFRVTRTPSK